MGKRGSKSEFGSGGAAPAAEAKQPVLVVKMPKAPKRQKKSEGIEFEKKETKNSITYTVRANGEEAGIINYSKLDISSTPYEATVGEKNPRLFSTLAKAKDYVKKELSK